jgi:hypothetical protein
MSDSNRQFEEDFRLVFAVSKKAKNLSKQEMATKVKQHSMSAARENQVVFKITSFSESPSAIGKTLNYNSRQGDLMLFDNLDNPLQVSEDSQVYKNFVNEIKWLNVGEHKTKRLTMNFIVSLSEGTPKREFEEGTREFLNQHFGNQPYLYTFHDDTEHYHGHVVAGLRNYQGQRIVTSKDQLLVWRQGFADALKNQGVEAEATPALSRGKVSQNTELRSKRRIQQRGETLSENAKPKQPNLIQKSLDKRLNAWNRIHDYMREEGLDGANELGNYIKDTYHHENYPLEPDF